MIKVFHNNSCSTSRAVLEFLDEYDVKFELIDMIEDPLSENEIRTLLKKLGLPAEALVRTKDRLFLENFAGKNLTEEQLITILAENPSLIQRPVLVKPGIAVIGRPLENVKNFIEP